MKNVDFLIFYEGFNREYQNIYLLKKELESRGYSVLLSHFSRKDSYNTFLKTSPKVVVTPWLRYNENVYKYTRFKKMKALVNLQWEQVYNKLNIDSGLCSIGGEALKYIHLCWGENSKKRLLDSGANEDSVFVTGGIHLDFCRKEFCEDFLSRDEIASRYDLDNSQKWILYVSGFSYASFDEETQKTYIEKYGEGYRELFRVAGESKNLTLEWIRDFCKQEPDTVFIYRPHPAETLREDLDALSEECPNFKVIKDFNIKQWLLVCDIINTWFSTSISEIYYLGKKCNIIRPVPLPDFIEIEVMEGGDFVTDKEEFIRRNAATDLENIPFPIAEEVISRYYSVKDECAYKRTADCLEKILKSDYVMPKPEFTKEEIASFSKKNKVWNLVSRYYAFVEKTGIKLSKLCPFYRKYLKNAENWVEHDSRFDYKSAEETVDRIWERIHPAEK